MSRLGESIETENRLAVDRDRGRGGRRGVTADGTDFLLGMMKIF